MTHIRAEAPEDIGAIRDITAAALAGASHSSGTEAPIVDALRSAGALTVSQVAVQAGDIVGHVAVSPVTIGTESLGWFGLGPVCVRPDRQGAGIGKAVIDSGLARLRDMGAQGCVVLGDPRYDARFGSESDPRLSYADVPAECFQRILSNGPPPMGRMRGQGTGVRARCLIDLRESRGAGRHGSGCRPQCHSGHRPMQHYRSIKPPGIPRSRDP